MTMKFVSRGVITEIISPGLITLGCLTIAYNSKQLIDRFIFQEDGTDTIPGMAGLVAISTAMSLHDEIPPNIRAIELNALKQIIIATALKFTSVAFILNNYHPWMKIYQYFANEEASIWEFEGKDILTPILQIGVMGMSISFEEHVKVNFPQLRSDTKLSTLEGIAGLLLMTGIGYAIYEPQPLKYFYNYVVNMGDLTDKNATIDMSPGITQLELFGLASCLLGLDSQPEFLLDKVSFLCATMISVDLTDKFYQMLSESYNYLTAENSTSIDSADFMQQEKTPLVSSITQCLLSEYNSSLT